MFPRSLLLLPLTGLVFLLQAFPVTGVVLMLLGAAFWSVLLINGALIGTAAEALSGRVSRWWLLLPAVAYSAYFVIAAQDHERLAALRADIAAQNAAVHIPFDPEKQQLLVPAGDAEMRFITQYALPAIFTHAMDRNRPNDRADRVVHAGLCSDINKDISFLRAGIIAGPYAGNDTCILSVPEKPTLPALAISTKQEATRNGRLQLHRIAVTATAPDGKTATLHGGTASVLTWLPMPLIGCALNDAAPSWDCDAQFARDSFIPLQAEKTWQDMLARALGLLPRAAPEPVADDAVQPMIQATRNATHAAALARLDHAIADISANPDGDPFTELYNDDTALRPRLPAMLAAMLEGVTTRREGRNTALRLFYLTASLKPETLAPYADRFDALWLADNQFEINRGSGATVETMDPACLTPEQAKMDRKTLTAMIAAKRNDQISDEALVEAYKHPGCHPIVGSANVLGINRDTSVRLLFVNGHPIIAYTPTSRDTYDSWTNQFSSEFVPHRSCETIGGVTQSFGRRSFCVPPPIAPLMQADYSAMAAHAR